MSFGLDNPYLVLGYIQMSPPDHFLTLSIELLLFFVDNELI
jgi:hypothetical protein